MIEALLSLVSVVALLLGSPGPAPLALAAVGTTFGVKEGIPFLLGILSGLTVAIVGATIGVAAMFSVYPSAKTVVQTIGGLYVLYVATRIATAPVASGEDSQISAPSFTDGFIFNILNPKAYAAFLAIFSQFLLPFENQAYAYLSTSVICILVATFVDSVWLFLGGAIRPIFRKPIQARLLRVFFAISMVLAIGWAFLKSI